MSSHTLHRTDTLRAHLEYCPDNVLIDVVDDNGNVYRIEKIAIELNKVTLVINKETDTEGGAKGAGSPLCDDRA